MSKLKGIVIKTKGRFMWVATEDRQFLRLPVPKDGVSQGQEVWVDPSEEISSAYHYKALAAGIILLLLVGTVFAAVFPGEKAVAHLALDINPSMELAINRHNLIIETVPLNEDAELLLKDLPLKNKEVYEALKLLIHQAQTAGYLTPDKDNLILLTVVEENEGKLLDPLKIKKTVLNDINELGLKGTVAVQKATEKERKQAKNEGLSVTSYLLKKKVAFKAKFKSGMPQHATDLVEELRAQGFKINELFDQVGVSIINKKVEKVTVPSGVLPKDAGNSKKDNNDNKPAGPKAPPVESQKKSEQAFPGQQDKESKERKISPKVEKKPVGAPPEENILPKQAEEKLKENQIIKEITPDQKPEEENLEFNYEDQEDQTETETTEDNTIEGPELITDTETKEAGTKEEQSTTEGLEETGDLSNSTGETYSSETITSGSIEEEIDETQTEEERESEPKPTSEKIDTTNDIDYSRGNISGSTPTPPGR